MQSKEETSNETVRKRNCGNKQAEHDETLSSVWNESIKAGRQITEEYREGREKVMVKVPKKTAIQLSRHHAGSKAASFTDTANQSVFSIFLLRFFSEFCSAKK